MATPSPQPGSDRRAFGRVAAAVYGALSLILLALVFQGSWRMVGDGFPGFLTLDNGIVAAFRGPGWTGAEVSLPVNGGVVVEVDGEPFAGGQALLDATAGRSPGSTVRYAVRHRGDVRTFEVPTMRLSAADYVSSFGSYLFIAAWFLALGTLGVALRPDRLEAWSLAAALGAVGAIFALAVDHLSAYRFITLYHLVEGLAPAAILHVALVFPGRRVQPGSRRLLVGGVAAALAASAIAEDSIFYVRPELAFYWDGVAYVLIACFGLALVASFGESFFRGRDALERTRAGVVLAGGLAGLVAPAASIFGFVLLGWPISANWWALLLPIFPAFLLYAIVRHNLLEAERVIRLAVGYAVVTTGAVLIYAVGLSLLSGVLWPSDRAGGAVSFALVVAIALSFEPLRRRVQAGIDRAFYRSRIEPAKILEESGAELASLGTEDEIGAYIPQRLRDALALEWVELRWGRSDGEGAQLTEPVTFRGERIGSIACGPKRSGAPYSANEIELVRGLAAQTSLALQNARALQALREAQETLLRTERLAAVGQFAGAVAHGIRNPLAGIRAAAQVAHGQAEREPLRESLASVLSEADRLEQRIRSLLDFSKPYEPSLREADLRAVVESAHRAIAPRARECGVSVDLSLPSETVKVHIDPEYLEDALLELAGNALRFMPEGGSLRLALSRDPGGIALRVSDSGRGVPEGVRHRLFELFFTTRREGTGVGLATVKKIVETQGGTIELESTGPSGTVFRIELPSESGA